MCVDVIFFFFYSTISCTISENIRADETIGNSPEKYGVEGDFYEGEGRLQIGGRSRGSARWNPDVYTYMYIRYVRLRLPWFVYFSRRSD